MTTEEFAHVLGTFPLMPADERQVTLVRVQERIVRSGVGFDGARPRSQARRARLREVALAFSSARCSASSFVAPSARANRAPGSTLEIVQ